jgi:hypothetical protein
MQLGVAAILMLSMARVEAADVIVPVDVVAEVALQRMPEQTLRDAKWRARSRALEIAAPALVESNVILRNDRTVLDELATQAQGLFIDEQWGELTPVAGRPTATIALKARVNTSAVQRVLCAVVKANHDPKVTLVVVARTPEDARWSDPIDKPGVARAALAASFSDACFTVAHERVTDVSANGEPSAAELKRIVHDANAQHVAFAAADITPAREAGTWTASLSVKMVNTSTGEIESIAAGRATNVRAASGALALAHAFSRDNAMVPRVMDDALSRVVRNWNGSGPLNSSVVQLLVNQSNDRSDVKDLQAAISRWIPDAKLSLRVAKGGQASYDVNLDGGAEYLASAIEGKPSGKRFIEVIEVSRGKVILKLNDAPQN